MAGPLNEHSRDTPWLACAAVLAWSGAAVYLWGSWCAFPDSNWNELRLAPAFALRHAVPLYPPLGGGPLSTWIYGPIGAAINLPATLAGSAALAVAVAGAINLLTLVLPLALLCRSTAGLQRNSPARRILAVALLVLALPATSLLFQVADHAAAALGLISTCLLARRAAPGLARTGLAAGLCVLAVWSKQTAVFLVVAHVLGLLAMRERGPAIHYALFAAGFGAVTALAGGWWFGFDNLWLNLVEIPARLPWGEIQDKLDRRWVQLVAYVVLPFVLGLAIARRTPPTDPESVRLLRFALIAFATLLPVGLLAFCKVGGDMNVLYGWYFLLPAIVVVWLGRAPIKHPPWLGPMLATLLILTARLPDFQALPLRPASGKLRSAERLAQANPGALWFPYNPVVTFYSDHKLYHVEDGIATRHLAGLGLSERDFRRALPPDLIAVVYPAAHTHPFALQLMPEYHTRTVAGDWAIFTRTPLP